MQVKIRRGTPTKSELVLDLCTQGYAAFSIGRMAQRQLARKVIEELAASGRVVDCREAISPNFPMCIVDTHWHQASDVTSAVAELDQRMAASEG